MSLFKKATDFFMGAKNPLGKNIPIQTQASPSQLKTQINGVEDKVNGIISPNCLPVNYASDDNTINITQTEQEIVINRKNSLSIDILDLSRVIDICAEMKAVEAYEKMMRESTNGNMFKKIGGFFKRGFQRMGRDAWIDSKKRDHIKNIQDQLKNGTISEFSLRQHIQEADTGIEKNAYLSHEEVDKELNVSNDVQKVIDEWISLPINSAERKQKIKELKTLLEKNYPLTTDLDQLEKSLVRVEKAKIEAELNTFEAKLNILDIGRIELGYGSRKGSFIVDILSKIKKSQAPKWIKSFVGHPNTAAILSALGTRSLVSLAAGGAHYD